MNKYYWWIIAVGLIGFGLIQPRLSVVHNVPNNYNVLITKPSDPLLISACDDIIHILKSGDNSRYNDALKLSELYLDIARLIELDGADAVIKTTEEIKQANSLSGLMLRMDIKGKYPNLSSAAQKVLITGIGDDAVMLDTQLRNKAVESFMALAWACNEGSK